MVIGPLVCYRMDNTDSKVTSLIEVLNTDSTVLSSVIVIGCSVAGIAGLALAGYCWYK